MSKVIIALVGNKRSGKSSTFNIMKEMCPHIIEITLANKLKNVSSEVFHIAREAFDDKRKEEVMTDYVRLRPSHIIDVCNAFGIENLTEAEINPHVGIVLNTPRQIAQYLGTELLRSFNPDIHCEHAVKDLPATCLCVVTDARFWSEYNYFQKNSDNFIPIYIDNKKAEEKAKGDNHASERDILDIAKKCLLVVNNNGELSELNIKVQAVMRHVEFLINGNNRSIGF